MKVLVTGANGFIGRNLCIALEQNQGHEVLRFTRDNSINELFEILQKADFVFHLAGVNRPIDEEDFQSVNVGLTGIILDTMDKTSRPIPLVLSSSTQAVLENPYGISKRHAEHMVVEWGSRNKVPVYVFRLPGVFGKWCKPNYNSVVATWCHSIARDEPITIIDPDKIVRLVYIDHVVNEMINSMQGNVQKDAEGFCSIPTVFVVSLGHIADRLKNFRNNRLDLFLPDCGNLFDRLLYSTYLSYIPESNLSYDLKCHEDNRGTLAEFIKSPFCGQMFVSRTHPGITRGNHWHYSKAEKFLVLEGEALVRFRQIDRDVITTYKVSGTKWQVLDIPPGTTHNITNIGETDLVTLFWASEILDPDNPDAWRLEVEGA